ncbi:7-cyano-7-deazaguanine synthase QueC [Luminiphilus sp.]|nr:7-cyano-7-deazaguanine synthase QueC [Luminiphilus sp.]
MKTKAVILTSGGLDSATLLAMAHSNGRECYSLSFDYGQRHRAELNAARGLAERYGDVIHRVVSLDLSAIGGSALTDMDIPVPTTPQEGIPITYVPARNTVFLSLALGWAEVLGASEIYIGVNAVDYSGYPDCRPEFIEAYQQLIGVATKAGVEGASISLETPLIDLSKGAIIDAGLRLGVDYSVTVSCYQADEMGRACGECDSCRLRAAGFEQAGVPDPTRYR